MDRIISLLAALVGLIALGGAILVHVNADTQRRELATELAGLRAAIAVGAQQPAAGASQLDPKTTMASGPAERMADIDTAGVAQQMPAASSGPSSSPEPVLEATAAQVSALQARVAELEQINAQQASALAEAEGRLAASSSRPAAPPQMAEAGSAVASVAPLVSSTTSPVPGPSMAEAAQDPSGPADDCIPVGTRFMGKTGDSFPICKTKAVVKVAAVSDGTAVIDGAGAVAAGSFADLGVKGCTVMVFSADLTGYAEMRVSCE